MSHILVLSFSPGAEGVLQQLEAATPGSETHRSSDGDSAAWLAPRWERATAVVAVGA